MLPGAGRRVQVDRENTPEGLDGRAVVGISRR